MSSRNFPGMPIESIAFPASTSPSGFGVGQCGEQLWAITNCCKERVICNAAAGYWDCDDCGKHVKTVDNTSGPLASMCYVTLSRGDIAQFASAWTGIPYEKLMVDKDEW